MKLAKQRNPFREINTNRTGKFLGGDSSFSEAGDKSTAVQGSIRLESNDYQDILSTEDCVLSALEKFNEAVQFK